MGLLIGTSVLMAHERGLLELERLGAERLAHRGFISVGTASELLHGSSGTGTRVQRARRTAFGEGVIDAVPVLAIDLLTARVHAELGAGLAEAGTPVGTHDLGIAAFAVDWKTMPLDCGSGGVAYPKSPFF